MNNITNAVRIIGGRWRGKKLSFPAISEIRPTHDRLRETLFNWLGQDIYQAHCLDLFAGSGALGFEAISRGAAHVTFVDNHPTVIQYLRKQARTFNTDNITIQQQDGSHALHASQGRYDIVFLDPPYQQGLIQSCCEMLADCDYLKPRTLIYIEAEIDLAPLPVPANWHCLHLKKTKTVQYALYSTEYNLKENP